MIHNRSKWLSPYSGLSYKQIKSSVIDYTVAQYPKLRTDIT